MVIVVWRGLYKRAVYMGCIDRWDGVYMKAREVEQVSKIFGIRRCVQDILEMLASSG